MLEALRAGKRPARKLFLLRGGQGLEEIRAAAGAVLVEELPRPELDRLTEATQHQGAVLWADPLPVQELREWLARAKDGPVVVLDEVEDPQNFGAIIRSAAALGASAVLFGKDRAAPLSTAAVKAAAGAAEYVDLVQVTNIARALEQLRAAGHWITGLDAAGDRLLWELDFRGRIALVVGSEGKGMRRLVREKCDYL
ncbi:MAG: RNA methyltransferase, partial [Candidatus Hydrogenedentes bacterium]|nr:RNA methyltransferase [Candidatus Hydrogenedentota bacterium]